MASLVIVVLAILVLSCSQTHTDADERFAPVTVVGVSKEVLAQVNVTRIMLNII